MATYVTSRGLAAGIGTKSHYVTVLLREAGSGQWPIPISCPVTGIAVLEERGAGRLGREVEDGSSEGEFRNVTEAAVQPPSCGKPDCPTLRWTWAGHPIRLTSELWLEQHRGADGSEGAKDRAAAGSHPGC
jgi:hypothetical protein